MFIKYFLPFLYLYRNKLKTFLTILVISCMTLTLASINSIVKSFDSDIESNTSIYKKFHTIDLTIKNLGLKEFVEIQNKIYKTTPEAKIFITKLDSIRNTGIFGFLPIKVLFVENNESSSFLEKIGWNLKEGRMPINGKKEIVLTENTINNRNLKIGDKVGKNIDEREILNGEFTIVGILNENGVRGGLGYLEEDCSNFDTIKNSIKTCYEYTPITLTIYNYSENDNLMEKTIIDIKNKYPQVSINTKTSIKDNMVKNYESIYKISDIIILIMTILIAISMGLTNLIFVMNKSYEIGLLSALYFSKLYLILKFSIEKIVEVVIGWVLGIFALYRLFDLINKIIYYPLSNKGIEVNIFNMLETTAIIPIAILFFTFIGIYTYLIRLDPIEIIEKSNI